MEEKSRSKCYFRNLREKAVSKQSQSNYPSGGGGKQKPFQPQPQPPFSGGGGMGGKSPGGGGQIYLFSHLLFKKKKLNDSRVLNFYFRALF